MAESQSSENIHLISKGLYRLVCSEIGTENVVHARQQTFAFIDIFQNCESSYPYDFLWSGSVAEGFDFKSSDNDIMVLNKNVLVLPNIFLFALFKSSRQTVLLMETDGVAPGFVLLRCLQFDFNNIIFHSLTQRGCNFYVSSKFVRETFLANSNCVVHGPCQTGVMDHMEYDLAHTLKCLFWPDQATSFISRSRNSGLPHSDLLKNILNGGCLFVAINSKGRRVNDDIDLEWRISFSHAERKLLHSMNHCQFLSYGLCKIFSSEVLKKSPSGDLLCSYFLKTALFWEICENTKGWIPENFMLKFWNVFRRIIKWISLGYCPNYFIPENNMFYGKIYGSQQIRLLRSLHDLYADGYRCLLKCASLKIGLTKIIQIPQFMKFIPEEDNLYVSIDYVQQQILSAICRRSYGYLDCAKLFRFLIAMLHLSSTSDELLYHAVKLQTNLVLQQIAELFILYPNIARFVHISNKEQYVNVRKGKAILRRTTTFLCHHQIKYTKCLYMNGNYSEAIDMVNFIKCKLESQMHVYEWNLIGEIIPMIKELQRMSYNEFISSFILTEVRMPAYSVMDELLMECLRDRLVNQVRDITLPPLVFLDVILILSYSKLNEKEKRKDVLKRLERLVSKDKKRHMNTCHECIAWKILSTCQQLCGDYFGALQSGINSINSYRNIVSMPLSP